MLPPEVIFAFPVLTCLFCRLAEMTDGKIATCSTDRNKELFDSEYNEVSEDECRSKLPTGAYLIGGMLHLCKIAGKGQYQMSKDDVSQIVVEEVIQDRISKNVYPKIEKAVAMQIKGDYEEFLLKTVKYIVLKTRKLKNG